MRLYSLFILVALRYVQCKAVQASVVFSCTDSSKLSGMARFGACMEKIDKTDPKLPPNQVGKDWLAHEAVRLNPKDNSFNCEKLEKNGKHRIMGANFCCSPAISDPAMTQKEVDTYCYPVKSK
ncbi:hypothetical protein PtA15_13A429 [Puccinia triticina]|uniref:Secreted protein n=2 Tax=Puccinia triticina TaxID=208348 RepID=A0ABY7D2F6_9BASI|nr:uncharacterized protein PtA15_13A429 [Puccinia triticina]WAQ91029.1 hypothetical protein PtA15_13A429 [Puccinia triticina]WAR61223.1 hypothetical protein PtB15_13B475 [Puccinia triticina]